MCPLFAELGGGEVAGWVTAAGAGGSTGILLLVLRWLLWTHLPGKDAQLERLIVAQDARIREKEETFKQALEAVIRHCKEEMSVTSGMLQRDLTRLTEVIGELREELREMRRESRPPTFRTPGA